MNRGILNCNPLNIRRVARSPWMGQRAKQTDKDFVQFQTVAWGLRAAFCILRTYARKYHAVCIRDIVSRWAPPTENNTERYIRNVCLWTGLGGLQRLTEKEWPTLVRAMVRQECGIVLSEEDLQAGFLLYKTF